MQEELQPIKADTTSIKTSIDVLREKVNAAEHRLGNVEKSVDDLTLRVNRIEAGTASTASSISCGPSYVEIRGFCKFEERDEKCIDDAKANKAINSMKEGIDEEVKDRIRHYELVADPSHYLRMHVDPDNFDVTYCAMKVWLRKNKALFTDDVAAKVWLKSEPPKLEKEQEKVFSKLRSFVEQKIKPKLTPAETELRFFWKPDWSAYALSGDNAVLLAHLEGNQVVWSNDLMTAVRLSRARMDLDYRSFRR
jgi:hypothetical protein